MSPALQGRVLISGPPGKSLQVTCLVTKGKQCFYKWQDLGSKVVKFNVTNNEGQLDKMHHLIWCNKKCITFFYVIFGQNSNDSLSLVKRKTNLKIPYCRAAVATGLEIPKKGNAKESSNYHIIAFISYASKVMLKILQARLQQYVNCELSDVQAGFRKDRGTENKLPTSTGS